MCFTVSTPPPSQTTALIHLVCSPPHPLPLIPPHVCRPCPPLSVTFGEDTAEPIGVSGSLSSSGSAGLRSPSHLRPREGAAVRRTQALPSGLPPAAAPGEGAGVRPAAGLPPLEPTPAVLPGPSERGLDRVTIGASCPEETRGGLSTDGGVPDLACIPAPPCDNAHGVSPGLLGARGLLGSMELTPAWTEPGEPGGQQPTEAGGPNSVFERDGFSFEEVEASALPGLGVSPTMMGLGPGSRPGQLQPYELIRRSTTGPIKTGGAAVAALSAPAAAAAAAVALADPSRATAAAAAVSQPSSSSLSFTMRQNQRERAAASAQQEAAREATAGSGPRRPRGDPARSPPPHSPLHPPSVPVTSHHHHLHGSPPGLAHSSPHVAAAANRQGPSIVITVDGDVSHIGEAGARSQEAEGHAHDFGLSSRLPSLPMASITKRLEKGRWLWAQELQVHDLGMFR